MQTLTLEEKLNDLRQSLKAFTAEWSEEYARYDKGELSSKDYESLAIGCLEFLGWAAGWLNQYDKMEHPLLTTTFCWSCFDKDNNFLRELIDDHEGKCEYARCS